MVLNHDGMRKNVYIRDVLGLHNDKRVFVSDHQGVPQRLPRLVRSWI